MISAVKRAARGWFRSWSQYAWLASPTPTTLRVAWRAGLFQANRFPGFIARCKLGGYKGGPKRAAYWRTLGFPNLALAREARWGGHKLEQWKQEELRRTPFAILDEPPGGLRTKNGRK